MKYMAKKNAAPSVIRDPRITSRREWLRDGIFVFFLLLVTGSSHVMIYQAVFGIESTLSNLLVPEMISFLLFVSAAFCAVSMLFRNSMFDRPIEELCRAARQITAGDFSVRVPLRQRKKKNRLDILYEDFNTMAEELSGTETLKNDFIAGVSHEIRTPLAVIHNYADALKQEPLSPEGRENLDVIMAASINLSKLVGDILQLSGLETREILPEPEAYSLSEQVTRCALDFIGRMEEKDINFEADIDDSITVCHDRYMLEIVWNNLISNAVKFTPAGGDIAVRLKTDYEHAVFSVEDSGCGISEETGKHIFDKFYQGDRSRATEGNGLGLALVRRIVELCGGGIEVDSSPGQGARFTVYLKLAAR